MKNAAIRLLLLVMLPVVFTTCKKPATAVNSDLEGVWNTLDYGPYSGSTITIRDGNSDSEWKFMPCCSSGTSNKPDYKGKAKLANDKLKIGKKIAHVDAYPGYDNSGNYVMKLDGTVFYGAFVPVNTLATVSGTDVVFTWNLCGDPDPAESIEIDYRVVGATAWNSTALTATSYHPNCMISGLQPATGYEWRICSVAGIHRSGWSNISTFTTQ